MTIYHTNCHFVLVYWVDEVLPGFDLHSDHSDRILRDYDNSFCKCFRCPLIVIGLSPLALLYWKGSKGSKTCSIVQLFQMCTSLITVSKVILKIFILDSASLFCTFYSLSWFHHKMPCEWMLKSWQLAI